MPIYENIPTVDMSFPEGFIRSLHADLNIESILDVGAGHGGVFDMAYWTDGPRSDRVIERAACDIHWIRPMPPSWATATNVDVHELTDHYLPRHFDLVQCMEVLEHVSNPRLALEQLIAVANKVVIFTSCDEWHHQGDEQEAIEKINPHQAYIKQPSLEDLQELGFTVRVDAGTRRQLIGWKYV